MSSILPDIVEYAIAQGLFVNHSSLNKTEVFFQCPWCHPGGLNRKYKLSLKRQDGVYKCWSCGERGGTIDFIMQIENKTKEEVIKELREKAGLGDVKRRKRHPAENLSSNQLRLIGFRTRPTHFMNKEYEKSSLDWIWDEWEEYLKSQKRFALQQLMIGIKSGNFSATVEIIRGISKKVGYDLVPEVFAVYGSGDRLPDWAVDAQIFVEETYRSIHQISPNRAAEDAVAL